MYFKKAEYKYSKMPTYLKLKDAVFGSKITNF